MLGLTNAEIKHCSVMYNLFRNRNNEIAGGLVDRFPRFDSCPTDFSNPRDQNISELLEVVSG